MPNPKRAQRALQRRIERRKRRLSIEQKLLNGATNITQIAAAVGVSPQTASFDVRAIQTEWTQRDPQITRERRARRIRQLENIAYEAMLAFEKTKQDRQKITTRYDRVRCKPCKGEGCGLCEGNGFTIVENVTAEVAGQAGDAAYLNVAVKCLTSIATLEGLQPINKRVKNTTKIGIHVGANGNGRTSNPYAHAPREKVLEAMRFLDELKRESKSKEIVDGRVVQ